jgi:hypothetical protein
MMNNGSGSYGGVWSYLVTLKVGDVMVNVKQIAPNQWAARQYARRNYDGAIVVSCI